MTITFQLNGQTLLPYEAEIVRKGNRSISVGKFKIGIGTNVKLGDTILVREDRVKPVADFAEASYVFSANAQNQIASDLNGVPTNGVKFRDGYADFSGDDAWIEIAHDPQFNLHPGMSLLWIGKFWSEPMISPDDGVPSNKEASAPLSNIPVGVKVVSDFPSGVKITKVSVFIQRLDAVGVPLVDSNWHLDVLDSTGVRKARYTNSITSLSTELTKFTIDVDVTVNAGDVFRVVRDLSGSGYSLRIYGKHNGVWGHYTAVSGIANADATFLPHFQIGDLGSDWEWLMCKTTGPGPRVDGWAFRYDPDGTIAVFVNGIRFASPRTKFYADGLEHAIYIEVFDDGTTNLWVDGEKVATGNSAGSTNTTRNIYIGSLGASGSFTKQCRVVELYDRPATDAEREAIFRDGSVRFVNWYKGKVIEKKKELSHIRVVTHDAMKELVNIEGRGRPYQGTPTSIVSNLINLFTTMRYSSEDIENEGGASVVFVGKLSDLVNNLLTRIGKVWSVDADDNFIIRGSELGENKRTYTHGVNCTIKEEVQDDSQVVNEYVVAYDGITGNQTETYTFGVDGDTQLYVPYDLPDDSTGTIGAIGTQIYVPGKVVSFTVNGGSLPTSPVFTRSVDHNGRVVYTWTSYAYIGIDQNVVVVIGASHIVGGSSPLANAQISITYEAQGPGIVSYKDFESQNQIGKRIKYRKVTADISTLEGMELAGGFGNARAAIHDRFKIQKLGFDIVNIHDTVRLVDANRSIDKSLFVESVKWQYPRGRSEIMVSDFGWDENDVVRDIIGKISDFNEEEENINHIETLGFDVAPNIWVRHSQPLGEVVPQTKIENSNVEPLAVLFNSEVNKYVIEYFANGAWVSEDATVVSPGVRILVQTSGSMTISKVRLLFDGEKIAEYDSEFTITRNASITFVYNVTAHAGYENIINTSRLVNVRTYLYPLGLDPSLSSWKFTRIEVGTGDTASANTDTALVAGLGQLSATGYIEKTFPPYHIVGVRYGESAANGVWREIGLFTSGGHLVARKVLDRPIKKTNALFGVVQWQIRLYPA